MEEHINTQKGEYPFNAEFSLDWKTKVAGFSYPAKMPDSQKGIKHKEDLSYFGHVYAQIAAVIFAGVNVLLLTKIGSSIFDFDSILSLCINGLLDLKLLPLFTIGYALTILLWIHINTHGFWWLFGKISVLLHRSSKKLRDEFPNTNASIKKLMMKKIEIDLRTHGGNRWFRVGDTIVLQRMSSTLCELEIPDIIGEHVLKIYSKCVDKEPTILSTRFWLVIKLDTADPLDGTIIVWT